MIFLAISTAKDQIATGITLKQRHGTHRVKEKDVCLVIVEYWSCFQTESLVKKGGILMAQFASQTTYRDEETRGIANPVPLGLLLLALATAMIGASFAHLLVPTVLAGISTIVVPVLIYGGVILVLAGMWAFRKNQPLGATLFSSYGGFLIILGALFLPLFGLNASIGTNVLASYHSLGLLFLCWTICSGILFLGALRTNMVMTAMLACLFLAYLFLTIGEFANAHSALLSIGGWLGIISALIAWYGALGTLLHSTGSQFQLPMGEIEGTPLAPAHRYGREPSM